MTRSGDLCSETKVMTDQSKLLVVATEFTMILIYSFNHGKNDIAGRDQGLTKYEHMVESQLFHIF